MIIHNEEVIKAGEPLSRAKKVLVMVHGRGDYADSFIQLAEELNLNGFSVFALQAIGNTWYPQSLMAPPNNNEPQLSLSLLGLNEMMDDLDGLSIKSSNIYLLGFSQGACLVLEFAARNARKYGGIIAFTGGLIGDRIYKENYGGQFERTPVFIGSSDDDPHVPLERLEDTEAILREMGATVEKVIYPGMGHTIGPDEIIKARLMLSM